VSGQATLIKLTKPVPNQRILLFSWSSPVYSTRGIESESRDHLRNFIDFFVIRCSSGD
jgi:hypothetical protein